MNCVHYQTFTNGYDWWTDAYGEAEHTGDTCRQTGTRTSTGKLPVTDCKPRTRDWECVQKRMRVYQMDETIDWIAISMERKVTCWNCDYPSPHSVHWILRINQFETISRDVPIVVWFNSWCWPKNKDTMLWAVDLLWNDDDPDFKSILTDSLWNWSMWSSCWEWEQVELVSHVGKTWTLTSIVFQSGRLFKNLGSEF